MMKLIFSNRKIDGILKTRNASEKIDENLKGKKLVLNTIQKIRDLTIYYEIK